MGNGKIGLKDVLGNLASALGATMGHLPSRTPFDTSDPGCEESRKYLHLEKGSRPFIDLSCKPYEE
jgi:hypothetical protein